MTTADVAAISRSRRWGASFAAADILRQKEIVAGQLVERIPLAAHIQETPEACQILATAIEWGRYAELFSFNGSSGLLSLENPGDEVSEAPRSTAPEG